MQTRYIILPHGGHSDSSSSGNHTPWGYEMKHVALHKAGDFDNAVDALETMLMKMSQLSDIEIRGECGAIMLKFISELASQRILVGM
jgi:hypothetical protein